MKNLGTLTDYGLDIDGFCEIEGADVGLEVVGLEGVWNNDWPDVVGLEDVQKC